MPDFGIDFDWQPQWNDWLRDIFAPRQPRFPSTPRRPVDQGRPSPARDVTQRQYSVIAASSLAPIRSMPWARDLMPNMYGIGPGGRILGRAIAKLRGRRKLTRKQREQLERTLSQIPQGPPSRYHPKPKPKPPAQIPRSPDESLAHKVLRTTGVIIGVPPDLFDSEIASGKSYEERARERRAEEREQAEEDRRKRRERREAEEFERKKVKEAAEEARAVAKAEQEKRESEARTAAATAAATVTPAKAGPWWQQVGKAILDAKLEEYKQRALAPRFSTTANFNGPIPTQTPQEPESVPLDNSLTSFYSVGVPSASASECECPPKKKRRGKRKARTVCYTGTYRERADGTTKLRRRKIPCQASSAKRR